jgi:hypothetical protein
MNMSELEKVIMGAAAAMVMIYLLGPSAIWRITKTFAEWALVILVLIWAS